MLKALQKRVDLERFSSSSKPGDVCRGCYSMLYEKYVLDTVSLSGYRFIANLGPYTNVEERARDGSCIVCKLIVQTMEQDEQAWRKFDRAFLVSMSHISRVAECVPFICHFKVRKIAGGTFKQLRVLIGNVDVCELLYATTMAINCPENRMFRTIWRARP